MNLPLYFLKGNRRYSNFLPYKIDTFDVLKFLKMKSDDVDEYFELVLHYMNRNSKIA